MWGRRERREEREILVAGEGGWCGGSSGGEFWWRWRWRWRGKWKCFPD
jgi:hypothetical protein